MKWILNQRVVKIRMLATTAVPSMQKPKAKSMQKGNVKMGQQSLIDPAMDMSGAVVNGGLVNLNKTVVEMDVEKVLEEQDTHDLYCPNCNSCITKRVILRKRKRTLQDPQVDSKREKTQPLLHPDMEASPDTTVANDRSQLISKRSRTGILGT